MSGVRADLNTIDISAVSETNMCHLTFIILPDLYKTENTENYTDIRAISCFNSRTHEACSRAIKTLELCEVPTLAEGALVYIGS